MKKQLLTEFLHHLLVAWTITAAVYLATENGWMTYIDGVTLALTEWRLDNPKNGSPSPNDQKPGVSTPQIGADKRVVVEISTQDYEDNFQVTSPLNRNVLSERIRELAKFEPEAIAIDIDISPGTSWKPDDDALDQAIDDIDKQHVKLFLITPIFEAQERGLGKVHQQWLKKMCDAGVTFGFPEGESENGVVLRYHKDYHSLGVVVRLWETWRKDTSPTSHGHDWICEELKDAKHISELRTLRDLAWTGAKQQESIPINLQVKPDLVTFRELSDGAKSAQARIKDQIVFLGGSYDPKDTFLTTLGESTGVRIHAAISLTDMKNACHRISYLIELGLGLGLGIVLSIFLNFYFRSRSVYDQSIFDGRIFGRQLGRTLSLYLVPILLCIGAFYFVMTTSETWLASGTWLNPAPMIVGVAIDAIVAQSALYGALHPFGEHTAKRLGARIFLLHPGLFWKIPLIIYSCVHLLLQTTQ